VKCVGDENREKKEEDRRKYLEKNLDAYHTINSCRWHKMLNSLRENNFDFPR